MRKLILLFSFLALFSIENKLYSFNFLFSDTIQSKLDTILCSAFGNPIAFYPKYDSTQYRFEWQDDIGNRIVATDYIVTNSKILILFAIPFDANRTLYIDTLNVKFHVFPEINLVLDSIKCFNGDSISIVDNSKVYGSFNKAFFSDENNMFYESLTRGLKFYVTNGDTITRYCKYTTEGCPEIIDTFQLATKFTPIIDFQSDLVCFGDSTTIFNKSVFDSKKAIIDFEIIELGSRFSTLNDFKLFVPQNGGKQKLYIKISQESCSSFDSIVISNKLKPESLFTPIKTCENEYLSFVNGSINVLPNSSYLLRINNISTSHQNFRLTDTLKDGAYNYSFVVDNLNGCFDTFYSVLQIDSVTYVDFSILDKGYCEKQDTISLMGSERGGLFSGLFVTDLNQGKGQFIPSFPTSNISVSYEYTNSLGCTDKVTQQVDTIYPKPKISISGLDPAYCEKDPPSTLRLNQTIIQNSVYKIYFNGGLVDTIIGLIYIFNPSIPGNYQVNNFYTDQHSCYNDTTINTTVNPLPRVQLDSIKIISPGSTLLVGNQFGVENDVNYIWSNGDTNAFTTLSQPGIYTLYAFNNNTGCSLQDSIEIVLDTVKVNRINIVKFGPNPTSSLLNINTFIQIDGIELLSINGLKQNLNGISRWSTDKSGQLTIDLSALQNGVYCLIIPNFARLLVLKT
ncbi:MAG TPA: hypothetical protein PK006_10045 [Saprospiraceae bacterium]|nr:hypothetical protein [Saprospiraceae bacterium]